MVDNTTYTNKIYVHDKVVKLFNTECKEQFRKFYNLPKTIRVTNHSVMVSMIKMYLDRELEEYEYQ